MILPAELLFVVLQELVFLEQEIGEHHAATVNLAHFAVVHLAAFAG